MAEIRSVLLDIVRPGPAHNQLLSPLTPYLALCGADGPVTISIAVRAASAPESAAAPALCQRRRRADPFAAARGRGARARRNARAGPVASAGAVLRAGQTRAPTAARWSTFGSRCRRSSWAWCRSSSRSPRTAFPARALRFSCRRARRSASPARSAAAGRSTTSGTARRASFSPSPLPAIWRRCRRSDHLRALRGRSIRGSTGATVPRSGSRTSRRS